ncbi:MAG: 1-acyl-sn-glycerol-3-phosphate acyltransferase [Clostridia bacterium]|nr:1-acyl-sn-glycerol-3-phosphate acyltransferase [Clostridia bacterium]
MIYIIIRYTLFPLIWLVLHPIVHRRKHLFFKGKGIIISNHLSLLDPVLVALITPRPVHFMAKSELFKTKIGNAFFRAFLAFPVQRKSADLSSLKNALKLLDEKKVFGIFPEGKRSLTGEMGKFEKGASLLALKSKAPVIPVYIHPKFHRLFPKMYVGEPINTEKLIENVPKSQQLDTLHAAIEGAVKALELEARSKKCK